MRMQAPIEVGKALKLLTVEQPDHGIALRQCRQRAHL